MLKKTVLIALISLILTQCQSGLWYKLSKKESKLFTAQYKTMLDETAGSVYFRHGYDPDLQFDYVFKEGKYSEKEISSRNSNMKNIITGYKPEEAIAFFEKVLEMKYTQQWKLELFKERKKWTEYTYLEKYIIPETTLFTDTLEKNLVQTNSTYAKNIELRKDEVKKATYKKLKEELERKEKDNNLNYY